MFQFLNIKQALTLIIVLSFVSTALANPVFEKFQEHFGNFQERAKQWGNNVKSQFSTFGSQFKNKFFSAGDSIRTNLQSRFRATSEPQRYEPVTSERSTLPVTLNLPKPNVVNNFADDVLQGVGISKEPSQSKLKLALGSPGDRVKPIEPDISKINRLDLIADHYWVYKNLQDRPVQPVSEILHTVPEARKDQAEVTPLEMKSLKGNELLQQFPSTTLLPGDGSPFKNPAKIVNIKGSGKPIAVEVMTPPQTVRNTELAQSEQSKVQSQGKYNLLRPLLDVNNLLLTEKVEDKTAPGGESHGVLHDFGAADRGFKFMQSIGSMDDLSLSSTERNKVGKDELRAKYRDPMGFASGKSGRVKSFEAEDMHDLRSMSKENFQLSDYYKLDAQTRQKAETVLGWDTSIGYMRAKPATTQLAELLRGRSMTPEHALEQMKGEAAKYGLGDKLIRMDWKDWRYQFQRSGVGEGNLNPESFKRIQEAVRRVESNPQKYGLSANEIEQIELKRERLSGKSPEEIASADAQNVRNLYTERFNRGKMIYDRDRHFDYNLNSIINNPDLSHIEPAVHRQVIIMDSHSEAGSGYHDDLVHDVLKNVHPKALTTLAHTPEEVSLSDGSFIQMSMNMRQSDRPTTEYKGDDASGQKQAMVVSAGNYGIEFNPGSSMNDRRIVVGATEADGMTMSDYSNQPMRNTELQKRFMVAPGVFKDVEGTSFAAPMVSGAMSKLLDYNPHLNPMQAQDILLASADPILVDKLGKPYDLKNVPAGQVEIYLKSKNIPLDDLMRGRSKYGMGRLNVKRALLMALDSAGESALKPVVSSATPAIPSSSIN